MLISIYAYLKFEILMNRSNPQVSTTEEKSALDESDRLNLGDASLRFAFQAEDFESQPMVDSRYVRFIVFLSGYAGEDYYDTPIPYHKCSNDELLALSPAESSAVDQLESIMEDESRYMFCLDWDKYGDQL